MCSKNQQTYFEAEIPVTQLFIGRQTAKVVFLSSKGFSMTEQSAREVAQELGGEPKQVSDNNWHVLIRHDDGRIILISDVAVCEYADEQALREGQVGNTIPCGPGNLRRW
jgi:hypothetical protein